jgi:hypothetical protein
MTNTIPAAVIDSGSRSLHPVDAGSVVDVSELHATFIFGIYYVGLTSWVTLVGSIMYLRNVCIIAHIHMMQRPKNNEPLSKLKINIRIHVGGSYHRATGYGALGFYS